MRYEYIGGRALKREMANGVDLDMRDGSGGTLYDALGRPIEWKHFDTNQGGDSLAIGFSYGYDAVGNKRWQRVLHNTDDSQRYAYDSASRLTAFVRGNFGATEQDWCDDPAATQLPAGMTQAREWMLDGVGNWSQVKTKVGGSAATESRSDTSFNEYSSIGGTAQSHDPNGNLTDDGTHLYEWDGLNRLVSVSDGATHAPIVTYAYDTGNRRMLLDEATASTSDTVYCYGGWQVLEEAPQSAPGAPDRQFVYGNYIDEALVMNADGNADGDCLDAGTDPAHYYHQNTLYSVYALTDASGVVVEAYSYDPYGNHTLHLDGPDAGSAVDFSSDDLRFAKGRSRWQNQRQFKGAAWSQYGDVYIVDAGAYVPERGRMNARVESVNGISGYGMGLNGDSGNVDGGGALRKIYWNFWNNVSNLSPNWVWKWKAHRDKDRLAPILMSHFLHGDGSDLEISWKRWFYKKDVGRFAEGVIEKAFQELRREAESDPDSKRMGKVSLYKWKSGFDGSTSSDYYYSIKDYSLHSMHGVYFTFVDGCLKGSVDSHPVMLVDLYDFGNNDEKGPMGMDDKDGWAMVQKGRAHEFDVKSSYTYNTVWTPEKGLMIW